MALITAKKTTEKEKVKIEINKEIYRAILEYCSWAKIDDINYFFEEASTFVFSKDKDWKNYQRTKIRTSTAK